MAASTHSLAGIRIIDLTMAWAGPMAVRFLSDLGADAIKIEVANHMDRWRGGTFAQRGSERYPDNDPGPDPWNRSSFFNTQNRNKKSLTLNLKSDEGKEIFRSLVAEADIVAENFSAGAMARLGLDYAELRAIKPDLIMLSMPALGRTGPESGYIAHGPTIEELAGTTFLQGYAGGPPQASGGFAWGDPIAGMYGAAAAMAALKQRQMSGEGQHVDLSHLESGVTFNFDAVLEHTLTGEVTPRLGNRDRVWAPQGVYPCAGQDRWIAISVTSDECWEHLKKAMGSPQWAADGRYSTAPGRHRHHDEIDRELSTWCSSWEHRELMHRLQLAGIPAGAVLDAGELAEDPHLDQRHFFQMVTHPSAGTHRYPGPPFTMLGVLPARNGPAPQFGEHNAEILDRLGFGSDEIEALKARGVISDLPLPQGD